MHINYLELLAATLAIKLLPKQIETFDTAEDKQHHCSIIYKQSRRHSLAGAHSSCQGFVDVVPREEPTHLSPKSPRDTEYYSQCTIPSSERSLRLDAELNNLQKNRQPTWSTDSRPVCIQSHNPVPSLLQLAARSLCSSHWCIPPGLVEENGFCNHLPPPPPLGTNNQGPSPSAGPESTGGTSSASLEDTTLIPNTTQHADRSPPPDSTGPGSNSQEGPSITCPSVSHMAHLREKYGNQELSEDATSLMLHSWRPRTNRSYNSLFNKWHSWCYKQGGDPFSGPISDVANFLAQLDKKGYQYNSLNMYRLAISSAHEKVDGFSIGQHPRTTQLMKGVFHSRPPLPKYTSTWDVQKVLDHLNFMGINEGISLKHLTLRLQCC